LDDDTVIPEDYVVVREGAFPFLDGLKQSPNAQVIYGHNGKFPEDKFERHQNPGLSTFFEHLGKKVNEVQSANNGLRVVDKLEDTMHEQLTVALERGVAKFEVTYPKDKRSHIENAGEGMIIGSTATKSGMPDYRTVEIAKQFLNSEFPVTELSRISVPFGPKELFAYLGCDTNVDSAAFARLLNDKTIHLPWWFVSDLDISSANPHVGDEAGKYRADNENLPVLLRRVQETTGDQYFYLGGIGTQVLHNRATTGYRPDLVTNATRGSLVGNIAALEAVRRIDFDSSGMPEIQPIENDYKVPEDHAQRVFEEFVDMTSISKAKISELEIHRTNSTDRGEIIVLDDKIKRYHEITSAFEKHMAGWDFKRWKAGIDTEVRDQLKFYRNILKVMPPVIEETGKLIKEGKYPIVEIRPSSQPITVYQS
jgi:hypothetical protein